MKAILSNQFLARALLVLSALLFSNAAFAEIQICLSKQVSNDGLVYEDASTVEEAVTITGTAYYRFTATKCDETSWLGLNNITLTDADLGIYDEVLDDLISETHTAPPSIFDYTDTEACMGPDEYNENTASVKGYTSFDGSLREASDNAWIHCKVVVVDGCTPGYWKQEQHFDSWSVPTDLWLGLPTATDTLFSAVFGVEITVRQKKADDVEGPTLLQALGALGGGINAVARHAAAAYLNTMNPDVMYGMTTAELFAGFTAAADDGGNFRVFKDTLVNFNEMGCPLN